MEAKVSEILENILGLLSLEGSFEVVEKEDEVEVSIEANDSGRLIGYKGETLDALQLLVNQILSKQGEEFKRVIVDVGGWRKSKENDLVRKAKGWAEQVKAEGKDLELEPMPSWQRRIIHMTISEIGGVESVSIGEGRERHLVIKTGAKKETKKKEAKTTKTKKASKKQTVE